MMEAEERPSKMRKMGHGAAEPERPMVQLPSEPKHDVSKEDEKGASSKGEQMEKQSDADDADSTDGVASIKVEKMPPPEGISKNAWKKIQKKAEWEAGRDFRKVKRKEKIQAKKARDRTAKMDAKAKHISPLAALGTAKSRRPKHVKLPITFLIDCGFDDLMMEKERISLGSQLTRAYSDNNRASFQAHLVVSSWGGQLKERFDTVLAKHHESWRGVVFTHKDFVEAAEMAKEAMKGKHGGQMAGTFSAYSSSDQPEIDSAKIDAHPDPSNHGGEGTSEPKDVVSKISDSLPSDNESASIEASTSEAAGAAQVKQVECDDKQNSTSQTKETRLTVSLETHEAPQPDVNLSLTTKESAPANGQHSILDSRHGLSQSSIPNPEEGEIVYLTSDSPYTLEELKPHSTYIIGGLVDKNRHKGICYRMACERGLKTAKLPIGEFMEMQSRFVLATNHVVEIMVRWLECGNWGKAFLDVIPKRKGGKLKDSDAAEQSAEHDSEL
jgi:tRNA (guanine9-N1)-methyltransferase